MSTADLQRLERLLDRSPHGRDPEAGPLLHRINKDLAERTSRGSSESVDVFRSATELLSRFGGDAYGESRISGLVDCFRFFFQVGAFPQALAASMAMHELARRMEKLDAMSWAKNLEGVALMELGDMGQALLSYSASLEIAEKIGNVVRQSSVLGNTGITFQYMGLYTEAIPCLKKSMSLNTHLQARHSCNLAQNYLELGQLDLGFEAIEWSISHEREPFDSLSALTRCIAEFTYAQLALADDDPALAREHSQLCLKYSRLGPPRASMLAKVVIGLCDVRSGKAKSGIRTLLETLDESRGIPSQEIDSLLALVQAYDQTGQPALALEYLARMLALIRENRQKSVEGLLAWSVELEGDVPAHLAIRESRLMARAADQRTKDVTIEMLERLALTADLREDKSGEHGRRVGTLSRLLAEAVGWKPQAAADLELAARVHDIGKIAIPESILRQSAPLQDHARTFMRTHCEAGAEILSHSRVPSVRLAQSIALCHHESWDGSGYPQGLAGSRIPIGARIVAIADAFDAMTHERSHSPAWSFEAACKVIRQETGRRFDPDPAAVFLELAERLRDQFGSVDTAMRIQGGASAVSGARRRIERIVAVVSKPLPRQLDSEIGN